MALRGRGRRASVDDAQLAEDHAEGHADGHAEGHGTDQPWWVSGGGGSEAWRAEDVLEEFLQDDDMICLEAQCLKNTFFDNSHFDIMKKMNPEITHKLLKCHADVSEFLKYRQQVSDKTIRSAYLTSLRLQKKHSRHKNPDDPDEEDEEQDEEENVEHSASSVPAATEKQQPPSRKEAPRSTTWAKRKTQIHLGEAIKEDPDEEDDEANRALPPSGLRRSETSRSLKDPTVAPPVRRSETEPIPSPANLPRKSMKVVATPKLKGQVSPLQRAGQEVTRTRPQPEAAMQADLGPSSLESASSRRPAKPVRSSQLDQRQRRGSVQVQVSRTLNERSAKAST